MKEALEEFQNEGRGFFEGDPSPIPNWGRGTLERAVYNDFDSCIFKNITFNGCQFDASFKHIAFQNCTFNNTNFSDAMFESNLFSSSSFTLCDAQEVTFIDTQFSDTYFWKSEFQSGVFLDCKIRDSAFITCNLSDTSFLQTHTRCSVMANSNLSGSLLFENAKQFFSFGNKSSTMDKPVIGVFWDFESPRSYAHKTYNVLKHLEASPLKFEYFIRGINLEQLTLEVNQHIDHVKKNGIENLSIPQAILMRAEPGSEIDKIQQKVRSVLKYFDALHIPGGGDIEPEFYGHERSSETQVEQDYRRSIAEFAAINQAKRINLPVLGTCRGLKFSMFFLEEH